MHLLLILPKPLLPEIPLTILRKTIYERIFMKRVVDLLNSAPLKTITKNHTTIPLQILPKLQTHHGNLLGPTPNLNLPRSRSRPLLTNGKSTNSSKLFSAVSKKTMILAYKATMTLLLLGKMQRLWFHLCVASNNSC